MIYDYEPDFMSNLIHNPANPDQQLCFRHEWIILYIVFGPKSHIKFDSQTTGPNTV